MWGGKVCIVRSTHKSKALDSRTTQDPSKAFHYALVKKAMPLNSHCGRFMGYGNHVHVMLVLKADNRIVRCRHGHVDEFGMTLKDEEGGLTPNEHLLCSYQSVGTDLADFRALLPQIEIAPSDLDFIPTPFVSKRCKELHIALPPWRTDHGLDFDLCISNCLPVLMAVHPMSPVRQFIPVKYTRGHYVVSIDNNEPITPGGVLDLLRHLQLCWRTNLISIVLHPVDSNSVTNYEALWAVHDSVTTLRHHLSRHLRRSHQYQRVYMSPSTVLTVPSGFSPFSLNTTRTMA